MKKKPKLKSIREEKAACIAAFKKYPEATRAWCIHHGYLCETIIDVVGGITGRIRYLEKFKDEEELAVRFRNMRPVKPLNKGERIGVPLFDRQWPGNTWDRRSHTIF